MLTLDLISEVQGALDNADEKRYPKATIVQNADRQMRGMFRDMARANKDYSNFSYCAKSTDAITPFVNGWEFRLPTWVESIVDVYYRVNTAAVQTSFSPYRWTTNSAQIGAVIRRRGDARDPNTNWSWEGNHTLKLWNMAVAPELVIRCVKIPSRLFYGKIQTVHASQNSLYLPTAVYGQVEAEEGAYINADFQITDTATTNATQYGDIRRCIYSNAATIVSTTRQHELIFDQNFTVTLAQNDSIQTVVPVPDEHTRYLVLKTAIACLQRKGADQIIRTLIASELGEEERMWKGAIQPRDSAGPRKWKLDSQLSQTYRDPERYYGYGW